MSLESSMEDVYRELALGFKSYYEMVCKEIITFEEIFKNKKFKTETKNKAREILEILYLEKAEHGKKAERYRKMFNGVKIGKRVITWG